MKRARSIRFHCLTNSQFVRHVAILASGTAIAQAIPIAVSPILSRLYAPEEFGLAAIYLACVTIAVVVATARYEQAITLPASDESAAHLVSFSLKLCAAVSCVSFLPIALWGETLAQFLDNPGLAPWLYLLPASVMATGAFSIFQYWCNRISHYRKMSETRVQNAGFTALLSIALGLGHLKGGMIVGAALGQLLSVAMIGRYVWLREREIFSGVTTAGEIAQARYYLSHPLHIAPAQLLGTIAVQIPVLVIGSFYNLSTAGFFSMAYRLVSMPSALIANAIGDVYRQRISIAYNERGEFRDIFLKTIANTVLLAVPPFAVLYFAAPIVFEFVFGPLWRIAGEYAQILVVASFFQFVFTPIDKGAVVVGATRYILVWHISRLSAFLLIFFAAVRYDLSIQTLLWCFVAVNVALYVTEGVVGFHLSKGKRTVR